MNAVRVGRGRGGRRRARGPGAGQSKTMSEDDAWDRGSGHERRHGTEEWWYEDGEIH